jgi:hypothetical protein
MNRTGDRELMIGHISKACRPIGGARPACPAIALAEVDFGRCNVQTCKIARILTPDPSLPSAGFALFSIWATRHRDATSALFFGRFDIEHPLAIYRSWSLRSAALARRAV